MFYYSDHLSEALLYLKRKKKEARKYIEKTQM